MHASPTLKLWMHHFHDGGIKATHYTSRLLHEKSFCGILVILMFIAGLLALIVLFGNTSALQNYGLPTPYGPYY